MTYKKYTQKFLQEKQKPILSLSDAITWEVTVYFRHHFLFLFPFRRPENLYSIHREQNEKKHSFSGHFRPHVYYKETDQCKYDDLDDMIWSILYDLFVQSSYIVLHPRLSFYQCHLLEQDKKEQKFESVRREVVSAITKVFNSTDANQYETDFL